MIIPLSWLMATPLLAAPALADDTRPSWQVFDDSPWGGHTTAEPFLARDCSPPSSLDDPLALDVLDPRSLPGCGRLVADVDDRVGLAIAVDDEIGEYPSVLVSMASEHPVAMCLRDSLETATPLGCTWLEPGPDLDWVVGDMPSVAQHAVTPRWLTFEVVDHGPTSIELDAVTLSAQSLRESTATGCRVTSRLPSGWALLALLFLAGRRRATPVSTQER